VAEVFLDTAYAIALSASSDQHHERAVALARQLDAEGIHLITTRAVVLEIGNALARLRHRNAAVALLETLEKDPKVEVVAAR
jgi:predicted nucleic acid-binding protein